MKKSIYSLLTLVAIFATSCGEQGPKGDKGDKGDQGEQGLVGPQGEQGPAGEFPKINLKDYEGMNFYDYSFDDEETETKVVRPGFEEVSKFNYPITDKSHYDEIESYNWFDIQLKVENNKLITGYNNGYIYLPEEEPFSTTFVYEIEVREYDLLEANNRYFEIEDGCEIVFGEDFIIWTDDDIYYSEDYLKSKGVQFFDAEDVLGEFIE